MRRISIFLFSTLSALVVLFSYRTSLGDANTVNAATSAQAHLVTTSPSTAASSDPAAAASVVDGSSVNTRYGPVQVEITVADGVITKVEAIDYPNTDRKDQQINSGAVPVLNSEVLSAQSAKIDGVSGATYTSNGYVRSLQSALDVAGL